MTIPIEMMTEDEQKQEAAAKADAKRVQIETDVGRMIDEARLFIEEELNPLRALATDYYMGRPFGNEEKGRSAVVSTDLRNTVKAQIPPLLKVFFGPEGAVEFRPNGPEDEAEAQQATDYIRYIVEEDNNGFLETHSILKDGLVRWTGIVKWWWEKTTRTEGISYTGLSDENLLELAMDQRNHIVATPEENIAPNMPPTYSAEVTRTVTEGRARFKACPPESIAWNRSARSFADARIVVHSEEYPFYELVAMGYPAAILLECMGSSTLELDKSMLDAARRFDRGTNLHSDDAMPLALRPVRLDEAYVYYDPDADDDNDQAPRETSLYKMCFVGNAHRLIAEPEKILDRPFAAFIPDPEPHTIVGLSTSNDTMDTQKTKSFILRSTLDSLSLAVIPRTEMVEGQVNVADLLNTEVGGIVRTRQPGMLREIKHSFVGPDTLPMMDFFDGITKTRTGVLGGDGILDPDVLQSSTKSGVDAVVSGSTQQLELLARIFADTCYKPLFRGLLRLTIEHQDRPRTIRLRGKYVEVDPSTWDATMDCTINVGLGAGLTEARLETLAAIKADQDNILQLMGPNNPLVGLSNARNTRSRMIQLAGYKNVDEFYKPIDPEMEKAMEAKAAEPTPPAPADPATMILAEAEKEKTHIAAIKAEADITQGQQRLDLDRQKMLLEDDRKRDELAAQTAVKLRELELQYQQKIMQADIDADIRRERAVIDARTRITTATIQAASTATASDEGTDD